MISAYQLQLEYGKDPFEIKILNNADARFQMSSKSASSGITTTDTSISYDGSSKDQQNQMLTLIVMSTTPDIELQISSKCSKKAEFKPIKIGVTGKHKTLENEFNPPNNTTTGTINLPGFVRPKTLSLEPLPQAEPHEQTTVRTHGFLDMQSFLILGAYLGGFIIIATIGYFLFKKIRNK